MLFQSATPDTSPYMIAGYTVFAVIMVIYLASLFFRRRNLEQDLSTLQALGTETKPTERRPAPTRATRRRASATRPAVTKGRRKPNKTTRKK
jgi:hypothetical protein